MPDPFSLSLCTIPLLSRTKTRSISAENPHGEPGAGGIASSNLGQGRKGSPCVSVKSGELLALADMKGPGIVQHIWVTLPSDHYALRSFVLRMHWDGETEPSVEVPIGDFFCSGFGTPAKVSSLPIVVNPTGGMNCYFPLPFKKSALITIENQGQKDIKGLYYQITYSLTDLADEIGYFHAQWRRASNLPLGKDYTLLDDVEGWGHYVGTYLALASLGRYWWGEGEIKFYIDDDEKYPTICGTGTEDYFGGAWCFYKNENGKKVEETYTTPFLGYPFYSRTSRDGESRFSDDSVPMHGLYRWHIMDPIHFEKRLRVTIQQIGHDGSALFERSDDLSSVSYWYQLEPHFKFPALPDPSQRMPR